MLSGYPPLPVMETLPVRRSPDPRIQSAFAFISANIHRKITLTDLVEDSGLSAARFSHLFALATGTTPGKYIRSLRQTHAHGFTGSHPAAPSRSSPAPRLRKSNRDSD
jgi:transcriptional regulator GlxA family with amidase domain